MINFVKNYIFVTVLTSLVLVFMSVGVVSAQSTNTSITSNKTEACKAISGGCGNSASSDAAFNSLWDNILTTVAFIVGAVSVLMIVVGGLRYVLSQGDPQATQNAKNTILYALVGLVVAFIARGLVVFVLNRI